MSEEFGDEYFNDSVDGALKDASDVESNGADQLDFAGNYLMRVVTKKFTTKEDKTYAFPRLEKSEQKKSLQCKLILEVVDGTVDKDGKPVVEAGAYVYENLTLSPAPGASKEKVVNTMKMLKPRLAALVGKENIPEKYTMDWVKEWLLADFEEDGNDFKVTRNHKMDNLVMCQFKVGVYNNKPTLNLKSMKRADTDAKSETTGESISAKATFEDSSTGDENAINALASGEAPDGAADIEVF